MTPERIEKIRWQANAQEADPYDDAEAIHECLNWIEQYRALEQALRTLVEDTDYEAGGLSCRDDCNTMFSRKRDAKCDCPVKAVTDAMAVLKSR